MFNCEHSKIFNLPPISEALAIHNLRSSLFIILLRDPKVLERGQRRQYAPSDPCRILPKGRRPDLHFHPIPCERRNLPLYPLNETRKKGGISSKHNIPIKDLAKFWVAFIDSSVYGFLQSCVILPGNTRLEQNFGSSRFNTPESAQRIVAH